VARNTGWRATSGAIVAFLDDDCYPAPDFLDRIRSCISRDDLGFVGGRVLLYDAADAPVSIQPRNHRVDIPPRSFLPPGFILGANVAFRREVLERLGGFDEKLGPGRLYGADDDDLVARASALGITGAYDPAPVVFHHHRRSKPEEVRALLAGYDMARGAFYAKMLWNPQTRGIYLWPALRRTAGSIRRRDFAVMAREFSGARKYFGS
jgi:GT2 family glycosyltransferase